MLEASARDTTADDGAYLASLIRMAGFAAGPPAEAALLQLQAWPDGEALVRACVPWKQSPKEALASWARSELRLLVGRPLGVFTEADLPPAADRPVDPAAPSTPSPAVSLGTRSGTDSP